MIETICKDDFSGSKCWTNVVQLDKMSKQCCKRVSGEEIFENSSLPREVALFFSGNPKSFVSFTSWKKCSEFNSKLDFSC